MTYPLFEDEKRKRKRKRRETPPEVCALFASLCHESGADTHMPRSQATIYWAKAWELHKDVSATPVQVERVANGLRAKRWEVTPCSIASHWSEFVGGTAADKRKRKRDEMDECFERVRRMDQAKVEVALATLKRQKPHDWSSWDYMDIKHGIGNDDVARLCVQICQLFDAEPRP